uniref:CitMHS domain-containing protein n=1 Tax=Heterorhabditis bacteriophora TaxID=37862 RepID=A0A1I7WVS6_HETBA
MTNLFTPRELSMAKGLLISVCFAANIGGSATITGTASNLVLVGQLEKLFPNADTGINFLSWITFAFPQAIACLGICWFVLYIVFLRNAPRGSAIVSRKLKEKYDRLPHISFAEVSMKKNILFFSNKIGLKLHLYQCVQKLFYFCSRCFNSWLPIILII